MKKISQTLIKAGKYYIITGSAGKVIEGVASAENGAAVVLGNYKKLQKQEWSFLRVGDGVYRLQNRETSKMLDLVSGGSSNGTWLHQWDDAGCSSQMWIIEPTNDGKVKIKTQLSMDKCVDVVGMSTETGAQLQIWEDVNGENQTWVISEVKQTRTRKAPVKKVDSAEVQEKTPRARKTVAKKATTAKTEKAVETKPRAKRTVKKAEEKV